MTYIQNSQKRIFYTNDTLCKLLCKPIVFVAKEGKNNIIYEIDSSNFKSVYPSESERS